MAPTFVGDSIHETEGNKGSEAMTGGSLLGGPGMTEMPGLQAALAAASAAMQAAGQSMPPPAPLTLQPDHSLSQVCILPPQHASMVNTPYTHLAFPVQSCSSVLYSAARRCWQKHRRCLQCTSCLTADRYCILRLQALCLQAPVAVGDQYGNMDLSYDGSHANRWDSAALVNPPPSASMPLEHTSLVQQPLLQDEPPTSNN